MRTSARQPKEVRLRVAKYFGAVCICGILLSYMLHGFVYPHRSSQDGGKKAPLTDPDDSYTIVISTYHRDVELTKNIEHWLSCPRVHQVQVVWHNPERQVIPRLKDMENEYTVYSNNKEIILRKLVIRHQVTNLLTNRFRVPTGGFDTQAVFNVDDDLVIDCGLMAAGFENWKRLGKDSMVGFEPRYIEDWSKGYSSTYPCRNCAYSVLWPTKGAFLHKSFYSLYFSSTYETIRRKVDEYTTGEDMLMVYVHFNSYFSQRHESPRTLCIQPGPNYQRTFYESSNRIGFFERLWYSTYVAPIQNGFKMGGFALNKRTASHRPEIMGLIKELSTQLTPSMLVPPKTNTFFFVHDQNGNGIVNSINVAV